MFQLYRPAILKHFSADVKTGVFNTIVTAAIAASNFFVPLMILFPLCKKNVFEARVSIYYFITLRFFCQLIFKKMITENHICFLLIIYYFVFYCKKRIPSVIITILHHIFMTAFREKNIAKIRAVFLLKSTERLSAKNLYIFGEADTITVNCQRKIPPPRGGISDCI